MRTIHLGVAVLVLTVAASVRAGGREGCDLDLGGPGAGQGKFADVRDITFDGQDHLYVLDGGRLDAKAKSLVGNFLVQVFGNDGKFVREFSIREEQTGEKNDAARIAVDARGHVYVTQPKADVVQEFAADGKLAARHAVAGAFAIAAGKLEGREVVVVASNAIKANKPVPCEELVLLRPGTAPGGDAAATAAGTLKLGRALTGCTDLVLDRQGRIFARAELNQVYQFDADGKLGRVLGGGTNQRLEDGSELYHTVAVDSKGCVYGITPGNPGKVCRFSADGKTVTQRDGQFAWADAWGTHSGYTPFAIDSKDRLWVAAVGNHAGDQKYHYRPAVVRTNANYFDEPGKSKTHSTRTLGLNLAAQTALPYNVTYDLKPIDVEFIVKAGNRQVRELTVKHQVVDMYKNAVAEGTLIVPLVDGVEARKIITFTPPAFGWYEVEFLASDGLEPLLGVACHIGVTPESPTMPKLAPGESPGGWEDAARQAFCGLPNLRVHPKPGNLDTIEKRIAECAKYGVTLLAQFEGQKECEPAFVQEVVTRFKGRIKYWEVWNEPNFGTTPEKYAALLKQLYALIKGIDPQAQVLGPAVCGVQMGWYEKFYAAGGGKACDILSLHDYEGHESIDPYHWKWKFGELRKLMAANGDAAKPVWQTERAILGVRTNTFTPGTQAMRMLLHRDLLETLGIPPEHNFHYYLNYGGYGGCPSYIWSAAGPHPAALALRTRAALTAGRGYQGQLDFGPTGNKLFMATRYAGADAQVVILRNLGTKPLPVSFAIAGPGGVEVVDAFGNCRAMLAAGERFEIAATSMPQYLVLQPGQTLEPVRFDLGTNLAKDAHFSYSAETKSDFAALNNGIYESPHAGDPRQYKYWVGELPSYPQTLEIGFDYPRTIHGVLLQGLRGDNGQCGLLSYDLEYLVGTTWTKLAEVRTPCPPSDMVSTPDAVVTTWYGDENVYLHQFPAVTTHRLRVVVQRATFGFLPDEIARQAKESDMPAKLILREVEVYGKGRGKRQARSDKR